MYNQEFYNDLEKINKEIYRSKLLLETVHPEDIINNNEQVLIEAGINFENIERMAAKMLGAIIKGLNKFTSMTSELLKRNDKVVQSYKKVDTNIINFKDFEYEINDIGSAYNRINSFVIPPFDSKNSDIILNNDGVNFKMGNESKFPNGMFLDNGQVNKTYFDGSSNVIKVNQSNAAAVFKDCLKVLTDRPTITKKITSECRNTVRMAQQLLNTKVPVTESVLLDTSIFKDDYLDILLEDAITTTDAIQKEQKDQQNGIQTNTNENTAANNINKTREAVVKYTSIIYDIESKIMSALDDLYNQSGKYCAKVAQLSNVHNK